MLSAIVIAFIAVAIAIGLAVAGLRQIAAVRNRMDSLRAELDEAVKRGAKEAGEIASKKVEMALRQLEVSKDKYEEAVGSQREHSGLLYLSADTDVTKAGTLATELADYTLRDLEHQVITGSAPLILRGGLYSGQPAVLDVVPDLIRAFIGAIGAEVLYSQDHGSRGRKFYVRWPTGAGEPATLLGSLLATATAGNGTAGTASTAAAADGPEPAPAATDDSASGSASAADDTAAPVLDGTAELDALLDAVRYGHPAVLHLGPLVIMNIEAGTEAGFAPRDWTGLDEDQRQTAETGVGPNLLNQIDATGIIDLSQ
jgi:hypothetical protein